VIDCLEGRGPGRALLLIFENTLWHDVARQDGCQKPGSHNGAPRTEGPAPEFGCGLTRLASPPDDVAHLIGVEGPHRVCADVAERPYLKQAHRPRFIVGELAHGDDVVLANRPEQLTYPAARALDELREILRTARAVLVVLDALLCPVDQRHLSRDANPPWCLRTSRPSCAPVTTDVKAGAMCRSVQAARHVTRIEGGGFKSVSWDFAACRLVNTAVAGSPRCRPSTAAAASRCIRPRQLHDQSERSIRLSSRCQVGLA